MSVLTLAEAKAHLNITDSGDDAEVQTFIDAAEAAISARVGPLEPVAALTVRVSGGGRTLLLPVSPAVSLTSVTPVGGTALTVGDLYLDQEAGSVAFKSDAPLTASWYDVVYVPGRATCPPDLLMADKELLRHMWATQRPGDGGRFSSPSQLVAANTIPGAAYLFPFRVEALLAPYTLSVGFA